MTDENLMAEAKRKGLSGTLGLARDAVRGALDKLSGSEGGNSNSLLTSLRRRW